MRKNLLEETYKVLSEYNRNTNDVWYVTDCICSATWEEFADEAKISIMIRDMVLMKSI